MPAVSSIFVESLMEQLSAPASNRPDGLYLNVTLIGIADYSASRRLLAAAAAGKPTVLVTVGVVSAIADTPMLTARLLPTSPWLSGAQFCLSSGLSCTRIRLVSSPSLRAAAAAAASATPVTSPAVKQRQLAKDIAPPLGAALLLGVATYVWRRRKRIATRAAPRTALRLGKAAAAPAAEPAPTRAEALAAVAAAAPTAAELERARQLEAQQRRVQPLTPEHRRGAAAWDAPHAQRTSAPKPSDNWSDLFSPTHA